MMYYFTRYAAIIVAGGLIASILVTRASSWTEIFGLGTLIATLTYLAFRVIPKRYEVTALVTLLFFILIGAPILYVVGSWVEPLPIRFPDYPFSKMNSLLYDYAQINVNLNPNPRHCGVVDDNQTRIQFITWVLAAGISVITTALFERWHHEDIQTKKEIEDYLANSDPNPES